MPRKTKRKEEYIPLREDDLKHATEIPVKQVRDEDLVKIEKIGEEGKQKGKVKLKTRSIEEELKIENESEEEKGENKEDFILIITEKPQAALKIASSFGNYKKLVEKGVPYYTLEKKDKKIVVACAVGHLYTLSSEKKGFPVFDIKWVPSYKKRNKWTKKYLDLLKRLVKKASEIIVATDYDIEGEVIGWNVVRFIAGKEVEKKARRMKFSTLTKEELKKSYENPEANINWGQAYAGETRHFLDWMYGINLSRALMEAIKKAGRFKILSIGRVQGPALKLIVDKELKIRNFKPEPYWQIFLKLKGHSLTLKYEKDIKKRQELDKFKDLEGKEGEATTEKKSRSLPPPAPFDLTSLQREAYRLYNISPSRTLQLAQSLYLAGLISYPRTSSQKIPSSINPNTILKKLSTRFKEVKLAKREKPVEGKKTDPAHPSIYPTGEFGAMSNEEEKIYNLVVKRFISCFCEDAEIHDKKIIFIINGLRFLAKGLEIKNKEWLEVYPAAIKEEKVGDINGKKIIEKVKVEEKMTSPPRRYTPASLITELEKRNLGTKATRANIIETLYNRNYIKEQQIRATPLGIHLISSLEKYSPIIIDEELTRHFEKEMQTIQQRQKPEELKSLQEKTLEEARKTIEEISEDFKKNEEEIGKELVKATEENYKQEREENELIICPKCKKGKLRILYNKKAKRYFVACSNYPECKTTFSLPPNGLIKPLKDKDGKIEICKECGFPKVIRMQKGKSPWKFCFNPECESNSEWQKKREKQDK